MKKNIKILFFSTIDCDFKMLLTFHCDFLHPYFLECVINFRCNEAPSNHNEMIVRSKKEILFVPFEKKLFFSCIFWMYHLIFLLWVSFFCVELLSFVYLKQFFLQFSTITRRILTGWHKKRELWHNFTSFLFLQNEYLYNSIAIVRSEIMPWDAAIRSIVVQNVVRNTASGHIYTLYQQKQKEKKTTHWYLLKKIRSVCLLTHQMCLKYNIPFFLCPPKIVPHIIEMRILYSFDYHKEIHPNISVIKYYIYDGSNRVQRIVYIEYDAETHVLFSSYFWWFFFCFLFYICFLLHAYSFPIFRFLSSLFTVACKYIWPTEMLMNSNSSINVITTK